MYLQHMACIQFSNEGSHSFLLTVVAEFFLFGFATDVYFIEITILNTGFRKNINHTTQ